MHDNTYILRNTLKKYPPFAIFKQNVNCGEVVSSEIWVIWIKNFMHASPLSSLLNPYSITVITSISKFKLLSPPFDGDFTFDNLQHISPTHLSPLTFLCLLVILLIFHMLSLTYVLRNLIIPMNFLLMSPKTLV